MKATKPLPTTVKELFERIKSEIRSDIAAGVIPKDIKNFSELHDHVDANCYGGLCDEGIDVDGEQWQKLSEMLNEAQGLADIWIKYGMEY